MDTFVFFCPHCNQKIEADEGMRGVETNCPSCNNRIIVDSPNTQNYFIKNIPDDEKLVNNPIISGEKMKEYKVLTQKDKWFSQKFDPEVLEKALNAYASQGWRVVSAATASFPGLLGGNREEMVVILERDK